MQYNSCKKWGVFLTKALKYVFLLFFAILVFLGGWSLLHPEEEEQSTIQQPARDHSISKPSTEDSGTPLVVLDPGHGGKDPGAMVGEVMEKDITLAVALMVREQLEEEGITVIMTREEDVYPTLTERADLANQEEADLYISIHVNALENNDSYAGIYTFYHPDKPSDKAVAETIQAAITSASGGIDRGVESEDYAVLRNTEMSAVLIETGFMSCPEELAKLQDAEYQKLLAQGIAQGISACLEN